MVDITKDNLKVQNKACRRCDLARKCAGIVTGWGNLESKLLIVTDPPTIEESLMPARAKIIFKKILKDAGIEDNSWYLTSIVKCASYEKRGKFKKVISHKQYQIEACKYWIWNELKLMQPKVVICMGKTACDTLLELDKKLILKSIVGEQIRVSYINAIFIPTYSPTYLLNLSDWHTTKTVKYFQTAKELINEQMGSPK